MEKNLCGRGTTQKNESDGRKIGFVHDSYDLLKWANPCIKVVKVEGKDSEEDACHEGELDRNENNGDTTFEIEAPNEDDINEVIRSICPPREWEKNGTNWIQYVSTEVCSRSEIQELSEKLKKVLKQSGARVKGVCEIRTYIFSELFVLPSLDEMIRQMTVKCMERALLLIRVRDDMRMTIETYKTLAESAIALGMERAVEAEEGVPQLLSYIDGYRKEKIDKEAELHELQKKYTASMRVFRDWKDREIAKHKRKIEFLKATNEGIQAQWDLITAWKPQNIEMDKYLFQEDA